ncbi:MAG: glycosyltransferase family 4 protein [Acidimicrobiales bacterium]|nr:glycosyltransferase family 4 protein [Acidimicrobiales bacterium]RZV48640.1 MAG: glycosyltransferase family 1 protein [Acidimicrobiales bacterium]
MVRVALTVEQNWFAVPGGTARSTNRLIRALAEHHPNEVQLRGFHGFHRRSPTLPVPSELSTTSIPVPGRLLVQLWGRKGWPAVDRWVPDADLVHSPAYVLPSTVRPTVVTLHDLAFVRHPEWFTAHGVRFFNRLLDRVRHGDQQVIVPSAETAADCVAAGISEARLHVIPWGVNPTTVDTDRARSFAAELGATAPFVLFVGTLEPRKNLTALADAMALVPDTPLVVVGPKGWGDVEVEGALLLGERSAEEVAMLMAAARVVAYPSTLEGFGLPVLEAMAQGTPVVVHAGSTPAAVAGPGGVEVDTGDAGQFAEAIRTLVDDPSFHADRSAAARERATEFTWENTAALTIAVYREAAQ